MPMERIRETFNDGVLIIGSLETKRNESREKIGTNFIEIAKMHFRRMMIREADSYALGENTLSKVTTKVKTMFNPIVKSDWKNKYIVKIQNEQYNVLYVDYDSNYCYFYLEKV